MFDIYAEITSRMISEMENGIIPWQKPWMACGAAISHTTGKPYSLLNQMLLGRAGEYLTYKQVQQEGGYVRKGEKAHMVVFWKWIDKEDEETGEVTQIPFLRYYNVFHVDQCEGIKARFAAQLPQMGKPFPASGEQLVDIALVSHVKQNPVPVGIEHLVQGHRQLHGSQIGGQMSAGFGYALYKKAPYFRAERLILLRAESQEVLAVLCSLQKLHDLKTSVMFGLVSVLFPGRDRRRLWADT